MAKLLFVRCAKSRLVTMPRHYAVVNAPICRGQELKEIQGLEEVKEVKEKKSRDGWLGLLARMGGHATGRADS
jgi:hypothetical protein